MLTTDFPQIVSAIEAHAGRAAPTRMKQFEEAVSALSAGLAAGEIANPVFVAAKGDVDRMFELAFDATIQNELRTLTASMRDEADFNYKSEPFATLNDFYYNGRPTAHLAAGKLKKASAFAVKHNLPVVRNYIAFLNEIMPLALAIETLKGKTVKRRVLSADEREQERYAPPVSTSTAVAQVKAILEGVVNDSFEGLKARIFNDGMALLDRFLAKKQGIMDGTIERVPFHGRVSKNAYSPEEYATIPGMRTDGALAARLHNLVERDSFRTDAQYVRREDAVARMEAKALHDATLIRDAYVTKNLKKLVSILEAKGDDLFEAVKPLSIQNLGYLTGSMLITFKDGSSFETNNYVTFVTNSYGTSFNRFPLTFHNVVMPDGSKMKGPSEKAMNTTFVGK